MNIAPYVCLFFLDLEEMLQAGTPWLLEVSVSRALRQYQSLCRTTGQWSEPGRWCWCSSGLVTSGQRVLWCSLVQSLGAGVGGLVG